MVVLNFDSGESSSRTRTLTYTLPNLNEITSVKVNTGSIFITKTDGDKVTVQVSGGGSVRSAITGWSPNPNLSMYVDNQTSSYYNNGGYSGSLSAYDVVTNTPSESKTINTNRSGAVYTYHVYRNGSWQYSHGTGNSPPTSVSYSSGGFSGTLYSVQGSGSDSTGYHTLPASPSEGTVSLYSTRMWYIDYSGTVIKPATTTTVTRYRGTVYKPQPDTPIYTYYYRYQITFDYIDFVAPPVNVDGVWREVKEVYTNVDGVWRKVTNIYGNVNGVWKQHVK